MASSTRPWPCSSSASATRARDVVVAEVLLAEAAREQGGVVGAQGVGEELVAGGGTERGSPREAVAEAGARGRRASRSGRERSA